MIFLFIYLLGCPALYGFYTVSVDKNTIARPVITSRQPNTILSEITIVVLVFISITYDLTIAIGEEYLIVFLQPLHHVVGIENSDLCGMLQSLCSHQLDIGPRDREDSTGAILSRTDRTKCLLCAVKWFGDRVSWQEGS